MTVDVYKDSDSGYLGGKHIHAETWRVRGNEAQMVDTSEHGPLSPAEDDSGVSTCKKPKWPNAPGFESEEVCEMGELSGALDGRAWSRRREGKESA